MSCWWSPADVPVTVTVWFAWSAVRIASAADLITWTTGIVALPAMPAAKVSSFSPRITPIAPASAAFWERAAEPQRRVSLLSVHSRKTIFPVRLCAIGSQPSRLDAALSLTTLPERSGLLPQA